MRRLTFSRTRFWMRTAAILFASVVGTGLPSAAQAWDWVVEVKVTALPADGTYTAAAFLTNVNVSASCTSTTSFITYTGAGPDVPSKIADTQGVYATLLSAMLTGRTVRVYGINAGCKVQNIWLF